MRRTMKNGTTENAAMNHTDEINGLEPNARQRLLDTATELFAEKGYAGTSVREIVDRAGVSKPIFSRIKTTTPAGYKRICFIFLVLLIK